MLLPALGPILVQSCVIQPDTVIFKMPGVFAIITGYTRLQCPIGTTCQLGLPRPAYKTWGPLILSAPWWYQATLHSHCTDHFCHGLYHFSGLNKLFNFLFSCRALFSSVFILAISAAWPLIFACLCLELWDRCSWSPISTAAVITVAFAHCFPWLLNMRANLPQNCVKLLESGEDRHCPLATTLK